MALYKRGKTYWTDIVVNRHRYRESLGTSDSRKAPGLEREFVAQLHRKAPNPTRNSKKFWALLLPEAIERYGAERSAPAPPLANALALTNRTLTKITREKSLTINLRGWRLVEHPRRSMARFPSSVSY